MTIAVTRKSTLSLSSSALLQELLNLFMELAAGVATSDCCQLEVNDVLVMQPFSHSSLVHLRTARADESVNLRKRSVLQTEDAGGICVYGETHYGCFFCSAKFIYLNVLAIRRIQDIRKVGRGNKSRTPGFDAGSQRKPPRARSCSES